MILAINPGATSDKFGLFGFDPRAPSLVCCHRTETVRHADDAIGRFPSVQDQLEFRAQALQRFIDEKNIPLGSVMAISCRGGLLKPVKRGIYRVSETMLSDLRKAERGSHVSNLAAQIGHELAKQRGIPCFVVNPVSVDELYSISRVSGHRHFKRRAQTHALNIFATAEKYAHDNSVNLNKINLIVMHLGTGISQAFLRRGKMVDVVNPMDEGAFSLDRSGHLPISQLALMWDNPDISSNDRRQIVMGKGGLFSHLGTKDFRVAMNMYCAGHRNARRVISAMALQIGKDAAGLAASARGEVDAIIITGGIAHEGVFVDMVLSHIKFLPGQRKIYPGEDELRALASGAAKVILNKEKAKEY